MRTTLIMTAQHKTIIAMTGILIVTVLFITRSAHPTQRNFILTPVADNFYSTSRVSYPLETCKKLLDLPALPMSQSDYKVQLLAAAPGSGSKWCRLSIGLLTGYNTNAVPSLSSSRKKDLQQAIGAVGRPIYFKTHFPFQPARGELSEKINKGPYRVVILIRNPFDAGFSEFVRSKGRRLGVATKNNKYGGIETTFKTATFLREHNSKQQASFEFTSFFKNYLTHWIKFHQYWIEEYKGQIKVMFYSDLAENERLFSDISEYFGYTPDSTTERRQRTECFYENYAITKTSRRPRVAIIEEAKGKLKTLFKDTTATKIKLVENMYYKRYGKRHGIL